MEKVQFVLHLFSSVLCGRTSMYTAGLNGSAKKGLVWELSVQSSRNDGKGQNISCLAHITSWIRRNQSRIHQSP